MRVNFGSISKVCELSESGIAFVLKQILGALSNAVKRDMSAKLNLRLGTLKISSSGILTFHS